jgi:SET domain-containing protein
MKEMDPRFEIRESPGAGWGLFARQDIKEGDFILEYTGTKVSTKIADASESKYLFEIDDDWTIDGVGQDNHARWINHACFPNVEADVLDGKILIHALRDIFAGEELTIDYGDEYFDEFIKPHGCMCGAAKHLS